MLYSASKSCFAEIQVGFLLTLTDDRTHTSEREGERGRCQRKGASKAFNKNKIPLELSYVQAFISLEQSIQEPEGGSAQARGPWLVRPRRILPACLPQRPGPVSSHICEFRTQILRYKEQDLHLLAGKEE